ncbi:MAG: hypothetical protein QM690_05835 [Sphingobium sp.]
MGSPIMPDPVTGVPKDTSNFYIDVARRAETAGGEFFFRPDSLFLNPSARHATRIQQPRPDLAPGSHHTRNAADRARKTASTGVYPPYIVARQLQSLNWLDVSAILNNQRISPAMLPQEDSPAHSRTHA